MVLKLFTGSYQGQGKVAVLPLVIAKAAVGEAHRHHLPVFAHPQNVDGLDIAIKSGVDVLAHTVPQSPLWTADFVVRLKRNGKDLKRERLLDRKQELRRIVGGVMPPLIYADHIYEHGSALFGKACELDLEGIVAKHHNMHHMTQSGLLGSRFEIEATHRW